MTADPAAADGFTDDQPLGVPADPTREPGFYDETFEYLAGMGIRQV